jgi:hypothetical protein
MKSAKRSLVPNRTRWVLDGVEINPRRIKAQIVEAYNKELFTAVGNIATQLERQIDKINANSSERGVGFLAVRYNQPLDGAEVKIEEIKENSVYEVFVPSEGKGSPGYKFNILDQGSPGSGGKPVTFPIYEGNLTKPNSLDLGNVTVSKPTRWHVNKPAKGFAGRRILETVKNKVRDLDKPVPKNILQRLLSYSPDDRNPFRFRPREVKVRMVQKK